MQDSVGTILNVMAASTGVGTLGAELPPLVAPPPEVPAPAPAPVPEISTEMLTGGSCGGRGVT